MKVKVANNYTIFVGLFFMLFPCVIYGATLNVPSSQYPTVQSAVNAANPGDTIILQAGVRFTETVVLKYKPGSDYITIQSSALSSLPTSGNRVNPAHSQYMPKITPPFNNTHAIETEITPNGPSHHYKLIGIEIEEYGTNQIINDLIALGTGESAQNSLFKVAHHFVIDRCYIHGNSSSNIKNGIALNSADTDIINSYISEIHAESVESHGIGGYNGIGRYQIINNYIGASSINILFGGASPSIQNLVPTDILVKRNYLKKKDEWLLENPNNPGFSRWQIKNNFELKNAKQVLIEDNIIDTNCGQNPRQGGISCTTGGQKGASVLFTVRNDDGTAPWTTIEDVTFRYNILRNVPMGIATLGIDDGHISQNVKNLNVENNLLLIDGTKYGGIGDCFTLVGGQNGIGMNNFTMNHNTCITLSGSSQYFVRAADGTIINGWNILNNIATPILSDKISHIYDEGSGEAGTLGLNNVAGNTWTMSRNILTFDVSNYSYWVSVYPTNNFYTHNTNEVGFIDAQNGNYQLSQSSTYKNQGTDGQDPGVNITLLNQRTACTESGLNSCSSVQTQTPFPGPNAPTIPIILEAENFDRGGQGVAYNDTVGTTSSGAYRSNPVEAVDIQARSTASNGFVVFEAAAGEWLEYTVNVPITGSYDIGVRYSSEFNNGKFRVEDCGSNPNNNSCTDITGLLTANSTGNWGNFRNVTKRGVPLTAGNHTLRLAMVTNSPDSCGCVVANFDAILFKLAQFDYDNDGRADLALFRPSNGTWYVQQSANGFTAMAFGQNGDVITPADFDGDGKTDFAVFRPSNGAWYRWNSSTGAFVAVTFGQSGDIPVQADYDGDGKADVAVFRPSDSGWYRLNSSNGLFVGVTFGQNGDKPAVGDYDGDGKSDIAVFRPSAGAWYYLKSSDGALVGVTFGANTDMITPGDYDGDGKTDIAVFRPSNGGWYRLNSSTGAFVAVTFGQSGDIPVPADYDGDGKVDIGVFRNGAWYSLNSSNGAFVGAIFGQSGDIPTPSTYVR